MAKPKTYSETISEHYDNMIKTILYDMPPFINEYITGITMQKSSKTRYGYLNDLKTFFMFLADTSPSFRVPVRTITLSYMKQITVQDIDDYIIYLRHYRTPDGREYHNGACGIERKLCSLSNMFSYFIKRNKLTTNPVLAVDRIPIKVKDRVYIESEEIERLLNSISSGDHLSPKSRTCHDKTKYRDLAIIILFLTSGIRISELAGLNMTDIEFNYPNYDSEGNEIYRCIVTRKGGNRDTIMLTSDTVDAIRIYIHQERALLLHSDDSDENALFISMHGHRMTTSTIHKMIKRYTDPIFATKNITAHAFRRTRGQNLYNETGDIFAVADILGHSSVSTTAKHYASVSEAHRREMAYKGQVPIKAPIIDDEE